MTENTTALELGAQIEAGQTDPVALAEAAFDRIGKSPFRDRIFARLTRERAISEAQAARERQQAGHRLGPFDGVPVSWKDLFDTAGVATESGSKLLAGRVPEADALALQRATAAGMVCVGKTHLSELAFSGLGINPCTDTAPNIHGDELAPGGSSSGAAASVAFGFVPIGIGSDTGGSVRIPSAWNDLTGFKTTFGLIPNDGVVPLCSGFDTAGPLCLDVSDAWLMTAIMANLPAELPQPKPLSRCQFLVSETLLLDDVATDQKAGFEEAVEALAAAGAQIDRKPVAEFEDILPLGPVLFPYEAWNEWGEAIEAQPELMFEPVRNRFASGRDITRSQYDTAWTQMLTLRETYNARIQEYDAVLAPTVAIPPPEVAPLLNDYELFSATNMMALRNTRFFNMFGSCALSLPTSKPASGLMVAAAGGMDSHLASIGLSIEKVLR